MEPTEVLDIAREAVYLVLKLATPLMLSALLVGLAISLFQALTQVQEMTLTFVPKIIVTFLAVVIAVPYISLNLGTFARKIFERIAHLGGG